jgi:hypothetical protein
LDVARGESAAYFDAVARQQQAKSWELRTAMSIARLWRDQGKRDLSLFKREGLPVEVLDELHWRIMPAIALIQPLVPDRGYLFWPATGYWRCPDGSHGGGGAAD